MITIKPVDGTKDAFVVLNGVGTIIYKTDNPVDMQEWFDTNSKSPLAWSYQYRYYDKDGVIHLVEITAE